MALGQKLVAELEATHELTSSWMAHYIAERMSAVKKAKPRNRGRLEDACAEAISIAWQNQRRFKNHLEALDDLDAVRRTVASLDPEGARSGRYFAQASNLKASPQVSQLLKLAVGLDGAARSLLRSILIQAAQKAVQSGQPWIGIARAAGLSEGFESPAVELAQLPSITSADLVTLEAFQLIARDFLREHQATPAPSSTKRKGRNSRQPSKVGAAR